MIKKAAILIALLLPIALQSYAIDSIRFEIKVDAVATIDQSIRVMYTINADCDKIQLLKEIKDFDIQAGPYTSKTATTIVKKRVTENKHETTFTYILSPRKEGTAHIPGASVKVDSKTYSCKGLDINILPKKVLEQERRNRVVP